MKDQVRDHERLQHILDAINTAEKMIEPYASVWLKRDILPGRSFTRSVYLPYQCSEAHSSITTQDFLFGEPLGAEKLNWVCEELTASTNQNRIIQIECIDRIPAPFSQGWIRDGTGYGYLSIKTIVQKVLNIISCRIKEFEVVLGSLYERVLMTWTVTIFSRIGKKIVPIEDMVFLREKIPNQEMVNMRIVYRQRFLRIATHEILFNSQQELAPWTGKTFSIRPGPEMPLSTIPWELFGCRLLIGLEH